MNLGLNGKKALITGASRGLGKAIANSLINEGAEVALVARTPINLAEITNDNKKDHQILKYDLTEESSPKLLYDELIQKDWIPNILIHNVGGNLDITDPLCSVFEWRKIYRLNFEIALELNNLFAQKLIDNAWGRIIHVSSISALENQGTVPYCTMKAALTAYTRSFGRYVSQYGIGVSAILPGAVYTEGGYWDLSLQKRPEHVKKYLDERMAIKRFGRPDEISSVVAFMCSEHASFIVGSSITVDGGQGRSFITDYDYS